MRLAFSWLSGSLLRRSASTSSSVNAVAGTNTTATTASAGGGLSGTNHSLAVSSTTSSGAVPVPDHLGVASIPPAPSILDSPIEHRSPKLRPASTTTRGHTTLWTAEDFDRGGRYPSVVVEEEPRIEYYHDLGRIDGGAGGRAAVDDSGFDDHIIYDDDAVLAEQDAILRGGGRGQTFSIDSTMSDNSGDRIFYLPGKSSSLVSLSNNPTNLAAGPSAAVSALASQDISPARDGITSSMVSNPTGYMRDLPRPFPLNMNIAPMSTSGMSSSMENSNSISMVQTFDEADVFAESIGYTRSISTGPLGPGPSVAPTATSSSVTVPTKRSKVSPTHRVHHNGNSANRQPSSNKTTPKAAQSHRVAPNSTTSNALDKRVLIVDDSATNRKLVNRLLRDKIKHRIEASDGAIACEIMQEALNSSSKNMIDVVILDYYMPNMDGPDAARAMRAMGYEGLIIGVTGNGHDVDMLRFQESGTDQVLMKPLNMDLFWSIVSGKDPSFLALTIIL